MFFDKRITVYNETTRYIAYGIHMPYNSNSILLANSTICIFHLYNILYLITEYSSCIA